MIVMSAMDFGQQCSGLEAANKCIRLGTAACIVNC